MHLDLKRKDPGSRVLFLYPSERGEGMRVRIKIKMRIKIGRRMKIRLRIKIKMRVEKKYE